MTEHEDLTRRLSDLGTQPVPEATRAEHLHAMRAAAVVTEHRPREKRFGRLAVAAAAIVGFLAGSTGLAVAGALPDPAQGVAHDVLSVVQVDVPDRPENRGSCVSQAAKLEDPAAKQAAKDDCPKGGPPAGVPGGGPDGAPGQQGTKPSRGANADADPCTGRPPWAGQKLTPAERDAAKATFAGQCPNRAKDDELEEPEIEEPEAETKAVPEAQPAPAPAPEAEAEVQPEAEPLPEAEPQPEAEPLPEDEGS